MSDKSNFGSGFVLGTIIGGIVGGVVGALITNNNKQEFNNNEEISAIKKIKSNISNREEILENKTNLEDKINQLNNAIDEVRFTLLKNTETELSEN